MRRSALRKSRFAFDQLPAEKAVELILHLKALLSQEDFEEACRLGGLDPGVTMDKEPAAYSGMRKPAGNFGQDAKGRLLHIACTSEEFAERFPHAAKIKVSK
jgi:hypothetical protein